eukprot:7391390-Ditylum_brightwellii.AAC.1
MFEKKSRITVGSITWDNQVGMNLIYHIAIPQSDDLQDYIKEACSDIVATAIENYPEPCTMKRVIQYA